MKITGELVSLMDTTFTLPDIWSSVPEKKSFLNVLTFSALGKFYLGGKYNRLYHHQY